VQALAASSETAFCTIKPVGKFHISQYSLEIDEINRIVKDVDGNEESTNILDDSNSAFIDSGDDYLDAFFSLIGSKFDRLTPIDGEQQLVLALGEEEIGVTLGANQQIRFDNLEHLALLSPEDFLTLRLYANNDAGNILWEYAFASLFAAVDNNRDGTVTVLNSADSDTDSTEKDKHPDRTSEINPFRFWVNNDFDVTNNKGSIEKLMVRCPSFTGNQVCEQGDEDPEDGNNTEAFWLSKIEAERDLEDFFPLYINSQLDKGSDGYPKLPEGVTFSMRANNININLFRGAWKEGTDYLTDTTIMQKQVESSADFDGDGAVERTHLFYLGDGIEYLNETPEKIFHQRELNQLSGRSSDARFIVESYKASPELCIDSPEECYLELSYKKGQQVLASAKIYMSFFDVRNYYDHYTVGEGLLGSLEPTPKKVNEEAGFEYLSLFPESDETAQEQKDDYIMFVHGWRMQYPERVAFGETAFKRLFWRGIRGDLVYIVGRQGGLKCLRMCMVSLKLFSRGRMHKIMVKVKL
jgi:hypothetical protein